MTKWTLLIGLLTYSSLGWSKELIMECSLYGEDMIFKMNTEESENSEELLMKRLYGDWITLNCFSSHITCVKGDDSVSQEIKHENDKSWTTYDFRFLRIHTDSPNLKTVKCVKW